MSEEKITHTLTAVLTQWEDYSLARLNSAFNTTKNSCLRIIGPEHFMVKFIHKNYASKASKLTLVDEGSGVVNT